MNGIIKAIAIGALLQIAVGSFLTVYLFQHTNDAALRYSQLAEAQANSYTDEVTRAQYNQLQIERSQERDELHKWVDQRIDLKLQQAFKESKR